MKTIRATQGELIRAVRDGPGLPSGVAEGSLLAGTEVQLCSLTMRAPGPSLTLVASDSSKSGSDDLLVMRLGCWACRKGALPPVPRAAREVQSGCRGHRDPRETTCCEQRGPSMVWGSFSAIQFSP